MWQCSYGDRLPLILGSFRNPFDEVERHPFNAYTRDDGSSDLKYDYDLGAFPILPINIAISTPQRGHRKHFTSLIQATHHSRRQCHSPKFLVTQWILVTALAWPRPSRGYRDESSRTIPTTTPSECSCQQILPPGSSMNPPVNTKAPSKAIPGLSMSDPRTVTMTANRSRSISRLMASL